MTACRRAEPLIRSPRAAAIMKRTHVTSTSTALIANTFRDNLRALGTAQKPAYNTAAYSRLVNRPLGRVFAAYGHRLGLTPNQATAISATLSGSALLLLALHAPTWWLGLLVAALLAAGYVMDSVDGQLARLRGGGSKAGEWLDHTIDCFKNGSLHLVVLISWFRFSDIRDGRLLIPLGYEVAGMVTYFGLILMPTLRPAQPGALDANPPESPLRKYVLLPMDYGALCWLFVLFGWATGFRWAYAVFFVCNAAALVLALRKWWRELRAIDAITATTR